MTGATDVVRRFNDAICAGDVEALASLMAVDHVFVDSAGARIAGRAACVAAWRGFFATFPDYRNVLARTVEREGDVVIVGRSSCSEPALDGPALWRAVVDDGLVREWHVAEDTPAERRALAIDW